MNSLVREALQRLPRKSEWVFTKPNGTPYTAVVCDVIEGGGYSGLSGGRHNEKAINSRRVNRRLVCNLRVVSYPVAKNILIGSGSSKLGLEG